MIKKLVSRYRGDRLKRNEDRIAALESRLAAVENELAGLRRASIVKEDKVPGQTVRIIEEECISCGTCIDYAPDVFVMDGKVKVVSQNGDIDAVKNAMKACPTKCIVME